MRIIYLCLRPPLSHTNGSRLHTCSVPCFFTYFGVLFLSVTHRSAFFPFIFLMVLQHDTVQLYQDVFNWFLPLATIHKTEINKFTYIILHMCNLPIDTSLEVELLGWRTFIISRDYQLSLQRLFPICTLTSHVGDSLESWGAGHWEQTCDLTVTLRI